MNIIVNKTGATALDLAWAAGLFEGEGCISLVGPRGKWHSPSCILGSTDEDVLRRFHKVLGIGSIHISRRPERLGNKRQWRWTAGGYRSAQYVISLLWNWLGERRRRRAYEVLTMFHGTLARKVRACWRGHDLTIEGARYASGSCVLCAKINSQIHYLRRKAAKEN